MNYEGSIAHTTVANCNSAEQLKTRRPHTESAITWHKEQAAFFEEELKLIDKKIKELERSPS